MILTPDEILEIGLELVGFDERRRRNATKLTNMNRFKTFYGSLSIVYACIWEDLQTTEIPEARIDNNKMDVTRFLMAIHFLRIYPTETERSGLFKICEKSAREWGCYFVEKIAALKEEKVSLPYCQPNQIDN